MDVSTIYKDSKLYKISQPFQQEATAIPTTPAAYSGVAVLYEHEPAPLLAEDMAAFLAKVIEAGMKLDSTQVLTANMCYSDVSLQRLAEQAATKIVVIFGLSWLATLKNANINKNEVVNLYGMKVLVTDSLDIINKDDAAKKAFWVQLKKVF